MTAMPQERAPGSPFWVSLGVELRAARTGKGMKQATMARHLNVARPTIAQYEKAAQRIPIDRLIRWCLFVDIDPAELMGRLTERHPELKDRKARET